MFIDNRNILDSKSLFHMKILKKNFLIGCIKEIKYFTLLQSQNFVL